MLKTPTSEVGLHVGEGRAAFVSCAALHGYQRAAHALAAVAVCVLARLSRDVVQGKRGLSSFQLSEASERRVN